MQVKLRRPELIYVLAHNLLFEQERGANPTLTLQQFQESVKQRVGQRILAAKKGQAK